MVGVDGNATEFGRTGTGMKLKCSSCLEEKPNSKIQQVKFGHTYRNVCDNCKGDNQ